MIRLLRIVAAPPPDRPGRLQRLLFGGAIAALIFCSHTSWAGNLATIIQNGEGQIAETRQLFFFSAIPDQDLSAYNEINVAEISQDGLANISGTVQAGGGNVILIDQTGIMNETSNVQLGSGNYIRLWQNGSRQSAEVSQTGSANFGWINQYGDGNQILLQQFGHGNQANIVQDGSGNRAAVYQIAY